MMRNWVAAYAAQHANEDAVEYVDEVATVLLDPQADERPLLHGSDVREISGLIGDHARPEQDTGQSLLGMAENCAARAAGAKFRQKKPVHCCTG